MLNRLMDMDDVQIVLFFEQFLFMIPVAIYSTIALMKYVRIKKKYYHLLAKNDADFAKSQYYKDFVRKNEKLDKFLDHFRLRCEDELD